MKAILIDTDHRTVRPIYFGGTLQHAYEILECQLIEGVYLEGNILYVDEEGLLRQPTMDKGLFRYKDFSQPLAGRGIIVGDGGEDWTDTTMTVEQVTDNVTWLGRAKTVIHW